MVSRKFCCCIPVRFGVLIMSILGFAGGSIVAVVGWHAVRNRDELHLNKKQEISLVVTSLSHTVLAAIALFGLIGVIAKRRGFISLFSAILSIHLGVSIASGVFFIWSLFHKAGKEEINTCISTTITESKQEECENQFKTARKIIIVLYILLWLIEFWGCIIVHGYLSQLRMEESQDIPTLAPLATAPMATTYNYGNQYPFSQPRSSVVQKEASSNV